jgi:FkbH-like protein
MQRTELHWLPQLPAWTESLAGLSTGSPSETWPALVALANVRLGALETMRLDRRRARLLAHPPPDLATMPVRLAVLASSTVDHLLPAIRIGGMRRGIWIETYTPEYGQYAQDLMDRASALHRFQPDAVLFALDSHHLVQGIEPGKDVRAWLEQRLVTLAGHWATAQQAFGCQVIQTVPLPVFTPLLGSNEHRLPWSRAAALRRLGAMLRDRADAAGVDLLCLDDRAASDGLASWYDPALWHHAKQEIHPTAAPLYGDLVGRMLAAAQGRASKCLVLDLDNTLWGGVIGDDGIAGIKLGQGSAAGEAYAAFQRYARDLGQRGVILAVCSKNDEANALEPFASHPEMVLKRDDIACFVANWTDKATNLRQIAARLNIGLDSLVFADDNPAERAIVRRELPMVAVPELPEDPTLYGACIADAGYFEALRITAEDLGRAAQYQDNLRRETLATSAADLASYLRSLQMRALWSRFDRLGLARIVQLINKTNQFNLTTIRVTDEQLAALIGDARALTLQIRLLDQFGDNGIIAIVIGTPEGDAIRLDTWLMSCRVLGRGVEEETLNLVVAEAQRLGARRLIGQYRPTAKNGMVREHYQRLGFALLAEHDGATEWTLSLEGWTARPTCIASVQATAAEPQASAPHLQTA